MSIFFGLREGVKVETPL